MIFIPASQFKDIEAEKCTNCYQKINEDTFNVHKTTHNETTVTRTNNILEDIIQGSIIIAKLSH